MKRTNTTLDREPMNSETIRQRQDFNYILKGASAAKVPIWKSIWFYGPVGIAMVTMVVSAVRINPKNEINDNNTTLSQINPMNPESNTANTLVVERSNKELTETKSDSKKEIVTPNETSVQKATARTTPIVKPDPTKIDPEWLEREKNSKAPEELAEAPIPEQPEPVIVKKASKTMPSIAGVFNGRVAVSKVCADGIIECNNGYQVISYEIQYDNGAGSAVDRVSGNKIPSYICGNLKRYNVGSPVFITKIIAMNENGERKNLLSMQIEPTF